MAMRARHFTRQQNLHGSDQIVGRGPAARHARIEELQGAAFVADGDGTSRFFDDRFGG
jgi:hypothetical protein